MKRISVLVCLSLLLASCSVKENVSESSPLAQNAEEASLVSGEIIVEFTDDMIDRIEGDLAKGNFEATKSNSINNVFGDLEVVSIERMYPDAGEFEPRHRAAGLHKWYIIKYNKPISGTKASEDLSLLDGINYSEPVRVIKPTAVFNDPYLGQQWHYINNGSLGELCLKGCDINVENVWKNYSAGKSDVIVSVVDGGIDLNHEDLQAVCIAGGPNGSKNFVDNSYTIVAHEHGTHVAGTIGAINNNGKGVCGIAGGKDGKGGVKLMSCQVFRDEGSKTYSASSFGDAIVWGADHGAVISQNSWGNEYKSAEDAKKGSVGSMKAPIDYFINYAGLDSKGNQVGPMKGGVVIFAAGNDAWQDAWPAEYSAEQPMCISVGAIASNFKRAYYSNYGDWVSICAPGGDVSVGYQITSTIPGNSYGKMQGTSMACPHVSGVAALIVSQYGGPGFTNQMLVDKLLGGANTKAVSSSSKIGPLVDAFGAITYGGTTPPEKVSAYSASGNANNIDFKWTVTSDPDDNKAYGYLLVASTNQYAIQNLDPKNIPAGVYSNQVEVGDLKVGEEISGRISDLEFSTTYYTAVFAYDYARNWSKSSDVKSCTTGLNNPPVIETDYTGDYKLKAHETLQVIYWITDPDGHKKTIDFEPGSSAVEFKEMTDGSYRMTIVGTTFPDGKVATAKIVVRDSYGAVTEKKIEYEILKNHAPTAKKEFENMFFERTAVKKTINMDDYIYDEDGEQLKYKAIIEPKTVVKFNQVDNVLNMTTLDYGQAQVTITATDACGEMSTFSFKVIVRDPAADPDVYPNPVTTVLNVSDGMQKNMKITISGSTGVELFKTEGEASIFNPMKIDMSSFAPGRYDVKIESENKTTNKTVIKI